MAVLLALDDTPEDLQAWCMARGAAALPFLQAGAGSLAARVGQRRRLGRAAGRMRDGDGAEDEADAAERGGYVSELPPLEGAGVLARKLREELQLAVQKLVEAGEPAPVARVLSEMDRSSDGGLSLDELKELLRRLGIDDMEET